MPVANEEIVSATASSFFLRNGLKSDDIEVCFKIVRDRYPDCRIVPVEGQGGCSYTVVLLRSGHDGDDEVVQFRLMEHAISREIAVDVRRCFGELAPEVRWIEEMDFGKVRVQVCGMTRVEGVRFCEVQPCRLRDLSRVEVDRLKELILGMAGFFATSWNRRKSTTVMNGKVGRSIRGRLSKLETELPSSWLRSRAGIARRAFDSRLLDRLPVVLNHGDLLPSNIMVEPRSWRLSGLVDWAEAEYLPFGMTLYGVEHLLGYMNVHRSFVYYEQATELRYMFWRRLKAEIPELKNPQVWGAMMLSREIGILLWHGIAWDEGRLDRVVDCENDGEELAYLETFLQGSYRSKESKL